MDRICFERPTFNMYLFILLCVVSYLVYFRFSQYESMSDFSIKNNLYDTVIELKDTLHQTQLKEQQCEIQLNALKNELNANLRQNTRENSIQSKFLDKIYNPLSGTSPMNPQGSFSNPRGYDSYRQFQQLGYISGPNGIYPVMGRHKFSNNTDKYDLYTIDNERGRIKIPFKTKNDYLYDNDSIQIPELGGEFTFKKYEDTNGNRYNPDIL